MVVWLCAYPSFVRWRLCWFCALPLSEVVLVERGVVYSRLLYCPKFSLEVFLCGKSCVDKLVKILLCEGRDVERCARTSKHIRVFAFDPLSLTLSLTLCLTSFILLIHTYMLSFVCLCASLVFNHESFI